MRKIDRTAGPGARFLVLAERQRPGRPRQARWTHHHDTGHGRATAHLLANQEREQEGAGIGATVVCCQALARPSQSLTRL